MDLSIDLSTHLIYLIYLIYLFACLCVLLSVSLLVCHLILGSITSDYYHTATCLWTFNSSNVCTIQVCTYGTPFMRKKLSSLLWTSRQTDSVRHNTRDFYRKLFQTLLSLLYCSAFLFLLIYCPYVLFIEFFVLLFPHFSSIRLLLSFALFHFASFTFSFSFFSFSFSSSSFCLLFHLVDSLLSCFLPFLTPLGFMLAFGDLAWVPFIYSLQVRERDESK